MKEESDMPPKKKFTREEIIQIAYEMAREKGIDAVVARELGKRMGTSSSPIFTAFKNMEELQLAVRDRAMHEFERFIKDALNYTPAFKYVGVKMIQFSMQEPKLFQLLSINYGLVHTVYGTNHFPDTLKEPCHIRCSGML